MLGGLGVTVGAGALTHDVLTNPDKYRDFFGLGPGGPTDDGGGPPPGGGTETVTDTETETITTPGGDGGGPGGGPKDPPGMSRNGGGLAAALRDTQNAITAERKRKEGANYSGPSTIKKPGKLQSNIGTDFSDVAETRLPAQQLKAMKNEQQALQDLTASLFEGLPEPKVNYLKDMDPYDPRRARRQHAPGSPLPPPTPGIPDFLMKRASKKNVKKPGNVKKA